MKNLPLVITCSLFLVCSLYSYGQVEKDRLHSYDYTAVYQLDFIGDSTNRSKITTEYFVLYMNGSSSLFTALKFLRMDSIKRVERLKGNPYGPSMDWYMANGTKNALVVFKEDHGTNIITHDKIAPEVSDHYAYEEPEAMDWELSGDTLTIGGRLCYKATTEFGGRQWYAWYDAELPIPDGPYKFSGLPGLIYKVGDTGNNWTYTLVNLKKEESDFMFNCSDRKHTHLTKEEFYKNKRNYYDNRITIMKSTGYTFTDENQAKKSYGRDNNWTELYP